MDKAILADGSPVPADFGYDPWDPALAKLEFDALFERMLRRLPRLELMEETRWKPRFVLRGLESFGVAA